MQTSAEKDLAYGQFVYDYVNQEMFWSEGMYALFDCDPSTFSPVIEQHTSFFLPESIEKLQGRIEYLEQLQASTRFNLKVVTAKHQYRIMEVTLHGEFVDDKIRQRYGTYRDITEWQEQQQDNAFFRERVNLALHASNTGTWDYHVLEDRLYWDDSMFTIFDVVSVKDMQRFGSWIDMIHPEDRNEFIDQFNMGSKGLLENNNLLFTSRIMTALGRISYIKINARFYIDEAGQNFRILGTCVDTTEAEIIQQEIVNQATLAQENMIKAQDATATRTRFLANMSHEIRTPMNTIMGALQILQTYSLDSDSSGLVDMAMTSSQDLLTLLNDILDLSKIDAHEMALESIAIDVTELCQQALAKFKLQLTKPLDLHLQIAPNFNPKRNSDPIRINQVLNNLLSNAIKFTNEGSVLLSVNGDAQEVRFTIKDTGIGIAEDKLEAIFHPFKQADDSTTRNFGGTGLGLAICQSLAELMQGNITVSSIPGVGSEFVFRVPMVITSMPFISNTSSKATEENFETFITPDLSHFKVLIVDDNESSGVILSRLLYPTKIGVDIVADANSAQERLASGKQYNLVITDLHMPNCNGAALCKMVRSNHPHIPILICTADLMYKQTLLDQAELFDDIMTKPITESVVIKKLTRLL